jgi:large subunit ribosomal protein L7/L12
MTNDRGRTSSFVLRLGIEKQNKYHISGELSMTQEEMIAAIENMTVLELSQLVKALEAKFGVSAAAPMMMAAGTMQMAGGGAAAPAEVVEEQTEFDVILKEVGEKKINVIKVVRAPAPVLSAVSKEAAADAKAKLEAEGAKADVK